MDPIFDLHQQNIGNLNRLNSKYFFGKDRVPDTEFLLARLKWQKKINSDARFNLQISKKNELEASKVINEMLNYYVERDSLVGTDISYENKKLRAYFSANYSQKRNKLNFGMTGVEIKLPETRLTFSRNFQDNIPLLNYSNRLDYAEFSIEKFMSNGYKYNGGISKDFDSNSRVKSLGGLKLFLESFDFFSKTDSKLFVLYSEIEFYKDLFLYL